MRSVVDSQTNALSLFDVVEEIEAKAIYARGETAPEAVPVSFNIVSMWERSSLATPEDKESCQLRIVNPSGKELARTEQVFNLNGQHVRSRVTLAVQQMPVKESGRYEVQMFERAGAKWKKVAAVPLTIRVVIREAGAPQRAS